jgi:hypothetical protein
VDLFLCALKYPTSFQAPLPGNGSCTRIEPSSSEFSFSFLPPFYFYLFVTNTILDPYDSPYALPPETHVDPRNPPRYPTYRNHLDHKKDREEQHQWLKSIKNLCAIAIVCVDEALYETSSRGNPRENLTFMASHPWKLEMMETSMSKEATS